MAQLWAVNKAIPGVTHSCEDKTFNIRGADELDHRGPFQPTPFCDSEHRGRWATTPKRAQLHGTARLNYSSLVSVLISEFVFTPGTHRGHDHTWLSHNFERKMTDVRGKRDPGAAEKQPLPREE